MITKRLFRPALHENAEPAQRVLGVAELAPDSETLAQMLADPVAEVRIAAARRSTALPALAAAWDREADPDVRATLVTAMGSVLAETQDGSLASALLQDESCTDVVRAEVARRTRDPERRRQAIGTIRGEEALIDVALLADHAETRIMAAERVVTQESLRKLFDAAKNKDHGVARLARHRIEAMTNRAEQEAKADALLAELEALTDRPGPILTTVVELNRRWQALDLSNDEPRRARADAARKLLQARFDREQEEQRNRMRFERKLREWLAALASPADATLFPALRIELAGLRDEAAQQGDERGLADLDQAEQRISVWEEEHRAIAGAEALVIEAELLAATTSIDNAKLPERWQALDRTIRTPALTRRFEAALMIVEQRRLEQIRAAQQEASATRQRVHALLHTAEQAIAAGQLGAARAAADELKTLKGSAGLLPKPTLQRQSRLVQQLTELERWESFGQHNARVQLCERAEALLATELDPAKVAPEVRKLREEWKTLDQQHAGVPKSMWERFDAACTKAYAPAARHFAELAAARKQAMKQREDFITASSAHAATLLTEPRDWRGIERWLRETGDKWREGDLGSVEPGAWKKLDAKLKLAVAPLRDALAAARGEAKASREALIAEAAALATKAMERDVPSQVKAIQARWQEQAKTMPLAQRDERGLWEQFRAACDAVFEARHSKRKVEEQQKHESRRGLEDICAMLERLAQSSDQEDQEVKRLARDLQDQWKKQAGRPDGLPAALESRFRNARTAVDSMLSARVRSRESAVWQTLAAKERLCEELDELVRTGNPVADSANAIERWEALPALPAAWEQKMAARRDAALRALSDAASMQAYAESIDRSAAAKDESILELEMLLGLDSPPDLQARRLALQVKQLRDRYKGAATVGAEGAGDRLVAWCAEPGVAQGRDRQRRERLFSAVARALNGVKPRGS